MKVPSTEVQNNFGKYMKIAAELEDVVITRKGREIAKLVPCEERNTIGETAVNYIVGDSRGMSYPEFIEMTEKSDLRYELIDGEAFLLTSPSFSHQAAVAELLAGMAVWFRGKKCRPLTSPFDVTLKKSEDNICVVQPDILVVCDMENIDEKGRYSGIPALAAEVLSSSSKSRDMIKKLDLYMQAGVGEYWLVDTDKKEVLVYSFEKQGGVKGIGDFTVFRGDEAVRSKVFEGLEIKLRDIFTV